MTKLTCPVPRQADGGEVVCDHLLHSIPDALLAALHAIQDTKDNRIVVCCHSCSPAARFASIRYQGEDLVYECLDEVPNLGKPVKYGKIIAVVEKRIDTTATTSISPEDNP